VESGEIARHVSLEVARLLRKERLRQKMSMRRLAAQSGLSQPMISYVERGISNATLDTLVRISIALGVDLSKLIKRASSGAKRMR
jgi:transcriptional regulator with XRE-family HTH domain